MDEQRIYTLIYNWLTTIVPPSIPIIKSHQNSPAPTGTYIVIDATTGGWGRVGMPHQGTPIGTSHWALNKAYSTQTHSYEVPVTLWQVEGNGKWLLLIQEALYKYNALAHKYFSVLRTGQVLSMPRLAGEEWIPEHQLQMTLLVNRRAFNKTTYIQDVEITNTGD
mgnify:FL=1